MDFSGLRKLFLKFAIEAEKTAYKYIYIIKIIRAARTKKIV